MIMMMIIMMMMVMMMVTGWCDGAALERRITVCRLRLRNFDSQPGRRGDRT